MKYTIEGLNQAEAIRLGLDVKDLVLLRWIMDFYNTGEMEMHSAGGKVYFWVRYQYLLQQLPILEITSNKVLARRMRHLQSCGVLESIRRPDSSGIRMYFRFSESALLTLLTETERQLDFNERGRHSKVPPLPRVEGVGTQKSRGSHSKVPGVGTQKFPADDSSIYDSSINDSKDKPTPQNGKHLKPLTPSQEFVEKFSQVYQELTQQPFKADEKHFILAAGLIKKYGLEEVIKKSQILALYCREGRVWFCKNGLADFTIETLSSRWNNLIPQVRLSEEELKKQKLTKELNKIKEHDERLKNTIK